MSANGKIIFMALGGAQEVGASCYFLKLGEFNCLLDCGCLRRGRFFFPPHFNALTQTPYLKNFRQISHVFISHAHLDHVAALPEFLALDDRATVYMTDLTWLITKIQLSARLSVREQEQISRVTFLQKIPLKNLSVSFHQAGHIPGAMMTLFNFRGKNILYTGDYSTFPTQLVSAAVLPSVNIDTLILCGTHARHAGYHANDAAFARILRQINFALSKKIPAYCRINQISKGVELLSALNKFLPSVEVFIDDQLMDVIRSFETARIGILSAQNHPLSSFSCTPGVIISTRPPPYRCNFWAIDCNFSLHDDFDAVVNFVRRVNPKTCVVVHSPPSRFIADETIAQILLREPDSRTNFIFPETFEALEI